jgi:SAM-dependent methyltransferase
LFGQAVAKAGPRFPRTVVYGDIVKGLPIEDGSCFGVYCSHVLEHLSLNDVRKALRNTYKLLAPNGTFRLVLPDLARLIQKYVARDCAPETAALSFMVDSGLGLVDRPRSIMEHLRHIIGNSRHLWMWDYPALRVELLSAGFSEVRRASVGDSLDTKFLEVEDVYRWEGNLGIECRRS